MLIFLGASEGLIIPRFFALREIFKTYCNIEPHLYYTCHVCWIVY